MFGYNVEFNLKAVIKGRVKPLYILLISADCGAQSQWINLGRTLKLSNYETGSELAQKKNAAIRTLSGDIISQQNINISSSSCLFCGQLYLHD